ncbi:MAG: YdeI/OmpD-associated family protein [Acidobacteriaceae bacterium]|nr:YdeI/OmpD-associated family protein [Acidobacteriaceae bacterium]
MTPARRRRYPFHFADAKQPGTRTARTEKAMPAILEGRGFLERRLDKADPKGMPARAPQSAINHKAFFGAEVRCGIT